MSDYTVIAAVSKELQRLLWSAFASDPQIQPIVGAQAAIVFSNPTETARQQANRLSIWLYQITEDEFVKNQTMLRGDPPGQQQYPPLALNLSYLVTPFAPSGDADHLLLGKTMQTLYDNAIVPLRDSADDVAEELRLVLCRLTLEELTRIWEALREPYRLSVCYQVRVTRIDSLRLPVRARVTDQTLGYGTKPLDVVG
jgi:hypothetical protein